jgi:hypothetical protein
MEEVGQEQQYFLELNTRLREFEERQQLLKDRLMLLSRGMVDIKEKLGSELRDLRKTSLKLQQDNDILRETVQLMSEKLNTTVRQEELATVKRQLDLIREALKNGNLR